MVSPDGHPYILINVPEEPYTLQLEYTHQNLSRILPRVGRNGGTCCVRAFIVCQRYLGVPQASLCLLADGASSF